MSTPASPTPGADFEPASRRTEAHVHQFYNELGKLARDLTVREGVRRLILAGPKERTAEFRRVLPKDLEDRVVAEECPFCGQPTRLDFIRGENENTDTLRDEFGGIAGLTRF